MEDSNKNNVQPNRTGRRHLKRALALGTILASLLGPGAVYAFGDDAPATMPSASGQNAGIITQGLDAGGEITMAPNQTRKIAASRKLKKANILKAEIADVVPLSPTEVLITPKKAGTTQLIVWDENDRTQIVDLIVQSDIVRLIKQYKSIYPNDKIEVTEINDTLSLRGKVKNLEEAAQIVDMATPYVANNTKILNFLEVSGGQQIMLKVRFAEVSKNAEQQLGVNFAFGDGTSFFANNVGPNPFTVPPSGSTAADILTSAGGGASQLMGQGALGNEVFQYFINCLRNNNVLRMLAEPDLVTTSGQEADFLAGGEIPIPVPQSGTGGGAVVTIAYKEYGIKLAFLPVAMGEGKIRIKVSPEVSELDYGHAIDINGSPVPGLTTRRVNTTVELNEGQAFAIAGLLSHEDTATVSAVPGLGDIPVLGTLFRSVQYQRNESELVILVTPVLVHGMNPADVPMVPGEKWRYPNERDLFFFNDIGGDASNTEHAPQIDQGPAPKFHGAYGFQAPVPQTAPTPQ